MLLIDCYNVLHVVMPPSFAGLDEAGLCKLLATHPWARQFGKIVVVADGSPKPGRASVSPVEGVSLRFSGRGKSADDVIIALIKDDSAPRALTVVSSDREIQRAARARRASVMASEGLMRELAKRSARRAKGEDRPDVIGPLPMSHVNDWLKEFKADPQALGAAESPAEAMRRAKAEAVKRVVEEAARPKKGAYRRYRREPDSAAEKPAAESPAKAEAKPTAKQTPPRAGESLREKGVTPSDAEYWMKEFGVDAGVEAEFEKEAAAEPVVPAKPLKKSAAPAKSPAPRENKPTRRSAEKAGEALDKLSDGDIAAWLKIFGMMPEDDKER